MARVASSPTPGLIAGRTRTPSLVGEADRESLDHQAIRSAVIEVQRESIIRLRDDGVIGDLALRRVERDLDLEVLRTGV